MKADGCWGGDVAAADAVASVRESIFVPRGPELVVSQRDFIITLLDVFLVGNLNGLG